MPEVVAGRVCGTCHACCILPEIPGLKRAGERCENLTADGECGIYQTRPQACRDFECGWKVDPRYREDERPNVVGLLVMGMRAGSAKLNVAHELRSRAVDSYHGQRLLKRAAKREIVGVAEHGKPAVFSELRLCGPTRLLGALSANVAKVVRG